mmetsp:Transcript_29516/g.87589  ORF Transcript_29516/g.87589 Transcript_29516/m.87589 type:complete len:421 (-) Transcript_29516:236-1498(-)
MSQMVEAPVEVERIPCAVHSDREEPLQGQREKRQQAAAKPPRKPKGDRPRTRVRQALTGPVEERYRMTSDTLGEGESCVVRMAVDKVTGERVALKTFVRGELPMKRQVDMCREMKIQSSLDHPHVGKVLDVFLGEDYGHLVMEHLQGGDVMEHVMKETRLRDQEAWLVVKQVLQALEYVHDRGYVHRDVKPENIMYESDSRDKVKLIDFGLCCKWWEGQVPMARHCGTEGYMAPEVARGCYTSKADMWSLGATVHTMLTGEMMGRSRDWFPVMSKHFWKLSAEAQRFVEDLLTVDPAMRMSAAEALRHSWMENAFSDRITDGTLTESTTASQHSGRSRRISALVTDQTDSDEEVGVAFGCCGSLKSRSAAKAGRVSLVQSLWSNLLGAKAPRQDSPAKEGVCSPGQKARKPSLASWLSRG